MPARLNRHSRESGNPGFFLYSSGCRVKSGMTTGACGFSGCRIGVGHDGWSLSSSCPRAPIVIPTEAGIQGLCFSFSGCRIGVRHDGWESLFVMPARPNRHSRESGNPGFFLYSSGYRIRPGMTTGACGFSGCRIGVRHDGWESLFVMPARPNRHSRGSGNPGFSLYSSGCQVRPGMTTGACGFSGYRVKVQHEG